jgi:hypothetical protein
LNIIIRIALAQFSQRQDAILDALRQESEDHLFQQHILTGSISAPNSTFLAIN